MGHVHFGNEFYGCCSVIRLLCRLAWTLLRVSVLVHDWLLHSSMIVHSELFLEKSVEISEKC